MKKLVLLLMLVIVSVGYGRSNNATTITNLVFDGTFDGSALDNFEYSINDGAQPWAGFAYTTSAGDIYPIVMESQAATISFDAYSASNTAASVRFRFEYNPWPDTEPSVETANVIISNDTLTTYSVEVPAQAGKTFSSFLFYINSESFDETVYMTNVVLSGLSDGDSSAPTPSTMTFASAPAAASDSSITMTATTASDDNGVEYYFACTTDNQYDSGWQSSPEYTVTGLSSAQTLEFTVQARDTSYAQNTTAVSAAASGTTSGTDNDAPTPSPMTATSDVSSTSIQFTATVATDASGVEYQFLNTSSNGPSSDWQTSNIYVASGLSADTTYTYTVQARDTSAAQNATATTEYTVTTASAETEEDSTVGLTTLSGSSADGTLIHSLLSSGLAVYSDAAGRAITFDSNGATFGTVQTGDGGRNHISTLANDFDSVDFTADITVVLDDAEQQAFFGIGSALAGNWDIPDHGAIGGNYYLQLTSTETASYAANQYGASVSGAPNPGSANADDIWNPEGDVQPSAGLGTHRLRIENDSSTGTFTLSVDENYAGGDFSADRVRGSLDHTEIWDAGEQPTQNLNYDTDEKVYLPGGQTPLAGEWETNSGNGTVNFDFPATGGSGDNGGYFEIDSSKPAWAVGVVSTNDYPNSGLTDDSLNGKYLPLADYGIQAGDLMTFSMDMKAISGSGMAGIKIEWQDSNKSEISNTGDSFKTPTGSWETYTWNFGIPADTVYMIVVPVQVDVDLTTGYDNLAVVPNPQVDDVASVAKIVFGGDDGVTFKDLSIVVDGGSVVVDPFSISSISSITGGSVITWTAQSGVTYEVQYKTSLVGGSWQTTGSSVTGDGAVSATSDVDAASAFFRVIGQ